MFSPPELAEPVLVLGCDVQDKVLANDAIPDDSHVFMWKRNKELSQP